VFDNNNDVCASISHRPDLSPLLPVLQAEGNPLFASADSILLELDLDEALMEEIYRLKHKYGKKVYAAVSNINIALDRRAFLQQTDCFVCNRQEAEVLFSIEFGCEEPGCLARRLSERVIDAEIPAMVVTLGGDGAIWADRYGQYGACAAQQVPVADTTGAGDAFFAGVAAGLTYGKTLAEACCIGVRLASSVICSLENTCPHFLPSEFGLKP
jgi:pseudouridine kinase